MNEAAFVIDFYLIDTFDEMMFRGMEKSRPFADKKKYFRHSIDTIVKADLYKRAFNKYACVLVENGSI